jgi:hypothetical protein
MSAENFECMEKDQLIELVKTLEYKVKELQKQINFYKPKYIVFMNREGTCEEIFFNDRDDLVNFVKDFLQYARGYECFDDGKLVFQNLKHFSSLTIKGSKLNLNEIDNLITADDWHRYQPLN